MTTDVYVPLAAVCWLTTAPTFAAFSHILSLPFSLPLYFCLPRHLRHVKVG